MDFTKIRNYLFLGLLAVVTGIFLYMMRLFAYPILWAAIIAVIFHPLYLRLARWLRHPNLGASVTLVLVIFIILIPLFTIGALLVRESVNLYDTYSTSRVEFAASVQSISNWLEHNPLTSRFHIDQNFWSEKFAEMTKTILDFIFRSLKELTQNSFTFAVMFVLMLYTLFYFIRDGQKMLRKIMFLCPLGDKNEVKLYKKFTATASAAIKGTLIVGIIQGTIGGVLFAIAGVKGALIWAIVMTIFSVVPGIGCAIVWLPAAIINLILGNVWQGLLILLGGIFVISIIDNILRPILVGRDAKMYPLIIMFSTIGGIVVFGASGFILGPVIASLFLSFWEMYEEYYGDELENN